MVFLFREGIDGPMEVYPEVITNMGTDLIIEDMIKELEESVTVYDSDYSIWFHGPGMPYFQYKYGNQEIKPEPKNQIICLQPFPEFDYIVCSNDYATKVLMSVYFQDRLGLQGDEFDF